MPILQPFLAIFPPTVSLSFTKMRFSSHFEVLNCVSLDWFKSYDLRCSLRPCASSANSQKIATNKWQFYDHIWPFFCQLHVTLFRGFTLLLIIYQWFSSCFFTNTNFVAKIPMKWKLIFYHVDFLQTGHCNIAH